MADDMWTKYVKKKRVKTNKIWLKIAENISRKIVKKPVVDFNSTNNEEFAKKNEKTIFGPRHPTLYFGIVIIKNINRVTFIVMQDTGNTDYEQNLTDVRSAAAAETRTGGTISGGIQVVLVYYGGILSAFNPEGFPRSGFPKGISVYHRDTSVIVLH